MSAILSTYFFTKFVNFFWRPAPQPSEADSFVRIPLRNPFVNTFFSFFYTFFFARKPVAIYLLLCYNTYINMYPFQEVSLCKSTK